ncbi:MAG: C-terminal helicase domain-containing protein, partial [Candidatus Thermoplasmatota archaeon]|nr:C-terminal helicase domain-containing protein [Candidatus Thermoplasmatota archaeon]
LRKRSLPHDGMDSVLVFTKTKHRADRLSFQLQKMGVRAGVIHGDKSQSQRVRALEAFRNGSQRVLIATDIAARGIDVEGISHVINYDVPHEAATYVHRVGRTARAQKEGDAISLVSREEQDDFDRIEQFIGMAIARENKTDPNAAPQAPMGRFSQPRHRPGVRPPPRHRYQHKF